MSFSLLLDFEYVLFASFSFISLGHRQRGQSERERGARDSRQLSRTKAEGERRRGGEEERRRQWQELEEELEEEFRR